MSVADESGRMGVLHGRMEEQELAIRNNKRKVAFIEVQKMGEVPWCLPSSEHAGDVAVGIQ